MHLQDLLTTHRDRIVARFVSEVERKELSPEGVSHSLLADHIPRFLDEIVVEVAREDGVRFSQDAGDHSLTARRHGAQRWTLGYDMDALMREYGILRHAILETATAVGVNLSNQEFDTLSKCLSVGVAEAVSEFARARDAQIATQKASLQFLAEAGQVLSSSLDYRSTITKLTRLLVPQMADWCAVYIESEPPEAMPITHVDPAKAELLRELFTKFPLPSDSPFGFANVAKSEKSQIVSSVTPEIAARMSTGPDHLALHQAIGTTSFMLVPLRVQNQTFGTLTLGFGDSSRHYDTSDLTLVNEVATRAAVAIDNARLYELSQKERSRVEAATRAKDEFVAMVSHELRTPLNAILGWVRLMRSGALTEDKRTHAFEVIERNAHAQNVLVADLLDISRAITGKIRLNASQVDLANIVDVAVEDARVALEAKRIDLQIDLDRRGAVMRGDSDRLQQVVWNLLTNAVKFTPKGGEISIALRRVDSDLELVVKDTGVGIRHDFLPHVFESFRQADASVARAHGGLGLGLSIVHHLVGLHGGTITVESEGPGKGACFVVRLPVSPLVSTTRGVSLVPAMKELEQEQPVVRGFPGISVLVVDDEPDARELVGFVLESAGMDVKVAGSAAEALHFLASYTPDVIVSDIGMPEEDGYSFIRSVRTLAASDKKDLPVIALTAFGRNEDRTRALVAGFNLHMAKPVEPNVLVRAVVDLAGGPRPPPV